MAQSFVIDQDATPFALENPAGGVEVMLSPPPSFPPPEDELTWASSARTEGQLLADSRPGNRTVSLTVRCFGALARQNLSALLEKVGKLKREGGSLTRTLDGDSVTFRVLTASAEVPDDEWWMLEHRSSVRVTVAFTCRPYGVGVESQLVQATETTLPVVTASAQAPAGDVLALGRLVIEDLQGADQGFVAWGVQSRYVSSADTAGLFYEAEALTPLGAASVTTVSGASGGSVVRQGTLTPTFAGMLSFQHGTHGYPTHVGDFNVWVRTYRPAANTGEVSVALEWGVGDMTRVTRNTPVTFAEDAHEDQFVWLNLGQVHIPEHATRWDGRVVAKSTVVGDDLDVDCVWLQPIAEGAGEVAVAAQGDTPESFDVRDEFSHTSGDLSGKVLPLGGTWSGAGDSDDFAINTSEGTAQRTALSDADPYTGRYAIAGNTAFTDVVVQVEFKVSALSNATYCGVFTRYVDTNNWVMARAIPQTNSGLRLTVIHRAGGTVIGKGDTWPTNLGPAKVDTWYVLRFAVQASGYFEAWLVPRGQVLGEPTLTGWLPGGSGLVGIYDANIGPSGVTRSYDNFWAAVPTRRAVVFANQSLEIRHDGAHREDATGTLWTPITVEGDYARIPPAGREQRDARVTALTSRGPRIAPGVVLDSAIDDKRLTVHTTPRYLLIP